VKVDVVVVTFNSGVMIGRCLESLTAQSHQPAIYVVDNASSDGTAENVRAGWPDVTVIELGQNAGFSVAMNAGAAAGSGELLVTLNDDIEVGEHFIARALEPFADERVGMVATVTTAPGSGLLDSFGIEVDRTLVAYNRQAGEVEPSAAGVVAAPMGGAGVFRREAFESVGGFEERFFSYGEDLDLGLRIANAGWELALAPDARAVHLGGATWGRFPDEKARRAAFGRGFILRRFGVLFGSSAPRALLIELASIGFALVRRRSTATLKARVSGWRAAGRKRFPVPADRVEREITLREQLRRMRG
jgi:GT2 family glycosyltransferase